MAPMMYICLHYAKDLPHTGKRSKLLRIPSDGKVSSKVLSPVCTMYGKLFKVPFNQAYWCYDLDDI